MKPIYFLLLVVFFACGTGKKNGSDKTLKPSVMTDNKIELSVNNQTTIKLPSRGASGLRIVFTISEPLVVSVTMKDLKPSDFDSLNLRPGDPVPAIFVIKGLKKGTATIHFAERKPGVNDGADIPMKNFEVNVSD